MIKKSTKIIFEDQERRSSEELIGGIPLSKGELVKVHKNGKTVEYIVHKKEVDCFMEEKDQRVNTVYRLRKK